MTNGSETRVTNIKKFPGKSGPHHLYTLNTAQGSFELSSIHRVKTVDGIRLVRDLRPGDQVFVGQRQRAVVSMSDRHARTDLYSVTFDPDGYMEALFCPQYGLQTLGELPVQDESTWLVLGECGVSLMSAAELEAAMPESYED